MKLLRNLLLLFAVISPINANVQLVPVPQNLVPVGPTHRLFNGCWSRYGDFQGMGYPTYTAEMHYCSDTPGAADGDEQQLFFCHGTTCHMSIGVRFSAIALMLIGQAACAFLKGFWMAPACVWRQLMSAEQWNNNVTSKAITGNEIVLWQPANPDLSLLTVIDYYAAGTKDHHVSLLPIFPIAMNANVHYKQIALGSKTGQLAYLYWEQLFAGKANLQSFGVSLPISRSLNMTALSTFTPIHLAPWFNMSIVDHPEDLPIWGRDQLTG